jgi:hypothetical protein
MEILSPLAPYPCYVTPLTSRFMTLTSLESVGTVLDTVFFVKSLVEAGYQGRHSINLDFNASLCGSCAARIISFVIMIDRPSSVVIFGGGK